MVKQTKKRLMTDEDLLEAFATFIPQQKMQKFDADERLDYGREEIKKLIRHYEHFDLDELDTLNEWEEFKVGLL